MKHTIYKQIRMTFLWLTLLMYLQLGYGGTGYTLLCFGDDCHNSVEEALNEKCIDCCVVPYETNSISSLNEVITLNGFYFDCCVYIPILTADLTELHVSTPRKLIPTQIAAPLNLHVFNLIPSENLSGVHITTLNPTLISLRTVTILI